MPQAGHSGGFDLVTNLGNHSAHNRLAVLKLRHAKLERESKEVSAQMAATSEEAKAEEADVAKAVQGGLQRPRSNSQSPAQTPPSTDNFSQMRAFASCGTGL